jgi:hypothetical protein
MNHLVDDVSLTTANAAKYLALSPSCLAKLRCYGGGPRFCKLGRRVTYRRSDLDVWREQRLCASTSQYSHRPHFGAGVSAI